VFVALQAVSTSEAINVKIAVDCFRIGSPFEVVIFW